MNILFIAQRVPYPANKGEKIRSFNQIKFLAESGHHVTVLAPIENEQDALYCQQLSGFDNITCKYKKLPAKWLRMIWGILRNTSLSVANFYTQHLQSVIDQEISSKSFDSIICTSSAVAKYVFCSNAINDLPKKPKLLMDFMDLDSDKWQQYADNTSFPMSRVYQREANLLAQYEQKIQQIFDSCFFIADAEVNLFKQQIANANNVFTLGNGMCTEEFYPVMQPINNKAPKFIFTGVMDYKPNIDAVVWFVEECWQPIIKRYPDAEFIIAGMNPSSTVEELKRYSGITITGFVDDILPYYHQADYFVAPFRLARGVQNKVLQAFACGLPVISTPMGAEGIDCVEGRDILLANAPKDFLVAIERLESDDIFKANIRNNALRLITEHYSWEGKLQVLKDILEN